MNQQDQRSDDDSTGVEDPARQPVRRAYKPVGWPAVHDLERHTSAPVFPLMVERQSIVPLARGVSDVLIAQHPDHAAVIRKALKNLCASTIYLHALAAENAARHSLDGSAVEPVSEADAAAARERLALRRQRAKAKMKARRAAARAEAAARAAKQKAQHDLEARREEKAARTAQHAANVARIAGPERVAVTLKPKRPSAKPAPAAGRGVVVVMKKTQGRPGTVRTFDLTNRRTR